MHRNTHTLTLSPLISWQKTSKVGHDYMEQKRGKGGVEKEGRGEVRKEREGKERRSEGRKEREGCRAFKECKTFL